MSYDISMQRHSARTRAEWLAGDDQVRGKFLRQLDESERIEVTDWEAQFIATFLAAPFPGSWWTDARRAACDAMMGHYKR
jgi:hypothetical protein